MSYLVETPLNDKTMIYSYNGARDFEKDGDLILQDETKALLEKISKNLEYGKKNDCIKDFLSVGGKYTKKFYALLNEALPVTMAYIFESVVDKWGFYSEADRNEFLDLAKEYVEKKEGDIIIAVKEGNFERIEEIADDVRKAWYSQVFERLY